MSVSSKEIIVQYTSHAELFRGFEHFGLDNRKKYSLSLKTLDAIPFLPFSKISHSSINKKGGLCGIKFFISLIPNFIIFY